MERVIILMVLVVAASSIPIPGYLPDDPFCASRPNGNYEYPAPHCSYFYQCSEGLTYVQRCYGQLIYNQTADQCEWAHLFPQEKQDECKEEEKSQVIHAFFKSRPIRDLSGDNFCEGKVNGNYEHPAPDCHLYYACSNGYTYIMKCPFTNLYYNPFNDQCDWPSSLPEARQAECEGREYTGEGPGEIPTTTTTLPPVVKPMDPFCQDKPNGNYEYPAPNCSLYYSCSNGLTYIMKCATDDLYFDQEHDRCDWPWNFPEEKRAECGDEGRYTDDDNQGSTDPTPPQSPSPSDDPFCEDKADGNYEYPAPNCSLFYSCSNGLTYIMKCATDDLYFDEEHDRCDWPWNFPEEKRAECGDEGRYTDDDNQGSTDPTPPHAPSPSDDPFCEDKLDGNYEYPAPNCSLFYSCSNGLTYIMHCPSDDLYYNVSGDSCDWAEDFPEEKRRECEWEDGEGSTGAPPEEIPSLPSANIVPTDSFCAGKDDGNYEYTAPHCDLFYSCSNGVTYVMRCHPNTLYYNEEDDRCDWPSNLSEERQRECQSQPPEEELTVKSSLKKGKETEEVGTKKQLKRKLI